MTNTQSQYTRESSYEDAMKNTDEGYSPIAFRIAFLDSSFTWPPGYSVADESKFKRVAVSMTTIFSDEKYNGQWGWIILPPDLKIQLGEILIEEEETDWSQQIQSAKENNQ